MINGFEHITRDLSDKEKKAAETIAKHLRDKVGQNKAVTSTRIISGMNKAYPGLHLSGARLRKIINYIRVKGLCHNLVGSSKGYYVENNTRELKKYVESLRQRAAAINAVAESFFDQKVSQGNLKF